MENFCKNMDNFREFVYKTKLDISTINQKLQIFKTQTQTL